MKNLWKGFVVGGLTGAAIGVLADGANRASRDVSHASREVSRAVSDADLPAKARDLGNRVAESDAVQHASERLREVAEPAAATVRRAAEAVGQQLPAVAPVGSAN